MCIQQRWIVNKYDGSRHYVKCGHCEACRQEKSLQRSNRVNAEFSSGRLGIFVTLTYMNSFVPYIYKSDYYRMCEEYDELCKQKKDDHTKMQFDYDVSLPIYRNFSVKQHRHGKTIKRNTEPIKILYPEDFISYGDEPKIPFGNLRNFKNIREINPSTNRYILDRDRIAVLHYDDLKDFLDRLRLKLQRAYKYDKRYEVFTVGEYGETYSRPHFHLLFSIPNGDYELFKQAITETWTFSNLRKRPRSIEVAYNPASYLASYVNCDENIPPLLQVAAPFKPRHKYSHRFGLSLKDFSYESVCQAYERGDFEYDCVRTRKGVTTIDTLSIPKYVISRYFPKWKGFSRLTTDQVYDVLERPFLIYRFAKQCNLTSEDCDSIINKLRNLRKRLPLDNLSKFEDWKRIYANIHNLYYANLLKLSYREVSSYNDWKYHYVNIHEFVSTYKRLSNFANLGKIEDLKQSEIDCGFHTPESFDNWLHWSVQDGELTIIDDNVYGRGYELLTLKDRAPTLKYLKVDPFDVQDPNYFPKNVDSDANMKYWWKMYNKSRKLSNELSKFKYA